MDKNNKSHCSRREFTAAAVSAAAFTIVPRHVLGGAGFTPPSDKINLAMIGVGGQGTYDMSQFMLLPEVQVIAENPITGEQTHTNTAYLVYVALDDAGCPTSVPPLLLETENEKRKAEEARERQERRLKQK